MYIYKVQIDTIWENAIFGNMAMYPKEARRLGRFWQGRAAKLILDQKSYKTRVFSMRQIE